MNKSLTAEHVVYSSVLLARLQQALLKEQTTFLNISISKTNRQADY